MEFNEKLQELRKSKGLTQEELARDLYVSRTAVSKWESSRGYPGIDSLKEISRYFSVSIDDLLSGEKLISIAEKEKQADIRNMCNAVIGAIDLFAFVLVLLPLYPHSTNEFVYSVNLINYTQTTNFNYYVYWVIFVGLMGAGFLKILLVKLGKENLNCYMTKISIVLSILAVIFLAMAREAYATPLVFTMLMLKMFMYMKYIEYNK
ncbi:MAG: helix-turn-helix transcriptional regulator [Oscillospiraceae bacterium]|nr:helix-turn-helix transcriptional regulator [Oscillospiraceae bacterium]